MSVTYNDPVADWLMSPGDLAIPGTIVGQLLDPASPQGKAAQRIYDLDLCLSCGKRPAAHNVGGSLAVTHGFTRRECDICLYTAQLQYAWGRTCALPKIAYRFACAHLADLLR